MPDAAQQRDIDDLRRAAQERNQEQAQYLLKRLLQSLDYYASIAIVAERLYGFLDIFESYHPDEEWVRQLLLGITSFGMAPNDSVAEMALQQRFDSPGSGNYLKAIYDLTQAMQSRHTAEARVGFMTSAIVNSIMAELAEAWYGENEDAWQRQRNNQVDPITGQYSDPGAAEISAQFWLDPGTAAYDRACWLEVTRRVEESLERKRPRA